jgi:hypothetical protein
MFWLTFDWAVKGTVSDAVHQQTYEGGKRPTYPADVNRGLEFLR